MIAERAADSNHTTSNVISSGDVGRSFVMEARIPNLKIDPDAVVWCPRLRRGSLICQETAVLILQPVIPNDVDSLADEFFGRGEKLCNGNLFGGLLRCDHQHCQAHQSEACNDPRHTP